MFVYHIDIELDLLFTIISTLIGAFFGAYFSFRFHQSSESSKAKIQIRPRISQLKVALGRYGASTNLTEKTIENMLYDSAEKQWVELREANNALEISTDTIQDVLSKGVKKQISQIHLLFDQLSDLINSADYAPKNGKTEDAKEKVRELKVILEKI